MLLTAGINTAGVPMGVYATRSMWEKLNHQKYKQMMLRKKLNLICVCLTETYVEWQNISW